MTRMEFADARVALAAAQKAGAGVPAYLRWVNRPLGGRAAIIAAGLGWTPDAVTALSAAFGLAGIGVLILAQTWWAGPLAALLLLIGYILDSADGQLARIQGRGGPAGEWLDHVVDGIRAPLVHVAIAVHLLRMDAHVLVATVAVLFSVLVSAWFLSQLLAEKLLPKAPRRADDSSRGVLDSFLKQPQDPSTTYALIVIIGLPAAFAILYIGLFCWQLVFFAASLYRKRAQLKAFEAV